MHAGRVPRSNHATVLPSLKSPLSITRVLLLIFSKSTTFTEPQMDPKAPGAVEDYVYSPLNAEKSEIRLLRLPLHMDDVLGRKMTTPLHGTLETYSLPDSKLSLVRRFSNVRKLPVFDALSYVWGENTRTHEIMIENKRLPITANLYGALRDFLKDAVWELHIWADAICINQEDLAERSSQILLMREIYHCAAEVKIWLGPS